MFILPFFLVGFSQCVRLFKIQLHHKTIEIMPNNYLDKFCTLIHGIRYLFGSIATCLFINKIWQKKHEIS